MPMSKLVADTVERRRNIGRNLLEARVEAACADEERRLVPNCRAERELAGDRDERNARMDELRVEPDRSGSNTTEPTKSSRR